VDILAITFVTACSAFVSAAAAPVVSVVIATRQIRVSLVSNNRERWTEALRDSLAEYMAMALSAAMLQEALEQEPLDALRENPELARVVERVAQARGRILLMMNPDKPEHLQLCLRVEEAYELLVDAKGALTPMSKITQAITAAGRNVLKSEWERVKRGD
jgi:ATP phosphoribosyltransferase regulatory subunit HisZ